MQAQLQPLIEHTCLYIQLAIQGPLCYTFSFSLINYVGAFQWPQLQLDHYLAWYQASSDHSYGHEFMVWALCSKAMQHWLLLYMSCSRFPRPQALQPAFFTVQYKPFLGPKKFHRQATRQGMGLHSKSEGLAL